MKHRHSFRVIREDDSRGKGKRSTLIFACRCGSSVSRARRPDDGPILRAARWEDRRPRRPPVRRPAIHRVWFAFLRRFMQNGEFSPQGFDLIRQVERWAEAHPCEVRALRCNDGLACTAGLVLIEHRTKDHYHGTTVVFIPQCIAEPPTWCFLYPHSRDALMSALGQIGRAARPIIRAEAARQREEYRILGLLRPTGPNRALTRHGGVAR